MKGTTYILPALLNTESQGPDSQLRSFVNAGDSLIALSYYEVFSTWTFAYENRETRLKAEIH